MATSIQWTDDTFNCITGCTRVSEGCRNCYAEKLSGTRLRLSPKYTGVAEDTHAGARWTGKVRLHPELLTKPLRWCPKASKKNPDGAWMVFVNDMSDTFHPEVPFEFIYNLYCMMRTVLWVNWQILTKRPERRREFYAWLLKRNKQGRPVRWLQAGMPEDESPAPNIWEGVSIEDQATADQRIPELLACPAAVRFVSYEPALGPVYLASSILKQSIRTKILPDWVIVGGESGPGARTCESHWIMSTIEQCELAGVPCFVKQLGAKPTIVRDGKPAIFQDSHGGDPAEWPEELRVRQWPVNGDGRSP